MKRIVAGFAVAGCAAGTACAQDNEMVVAVSNRVSEVTPTCSVVVQARWQADAWQFAGAAFAVTAEADPGGFGNPEVLLHGPGSQGGVVSPDGDSVTGIVSEETCLPSGCDPGPCPDPVYLWRAAWSTDDFTPRVVDLATETAEFDVYTDNGCTRRSFLDQLGEGAASILVTCYADCDQSSGVGVLDLFDFLCFVNRFNVASLDADCDRSGVLDLFDFLCFTNKFNAGCPA